MGKKLTIADLANVIESHHNAVVILDNDSWWIQDRDSDDMICTSSDMRYSCGPYGRDILEALALLAGIEVEDC